MKTAIITGVTGQSGSYLSELLLDKNYEVIGVKRRSSTNTTKNIEQILDHPNFHLVEGDIIDAHSVSGLISKYKPDEFFNLAAMSHVGESFKQPTYTFMADAVGPLNILEAVRTINPTTKVYQASTSELFASNYSTDPTTLEKYQDEDTPLGANSPYAAAKLAAHNLVHIYRDGYGIFACAGILHNHTSQRRGEDFVTRKITKYVAKLSQLNISKSIDKLPLLKLGNIGAMRDWGYAKDYVEAMWLMLQQEVPDDYVIATGIGHSVRDFLVEAFKHIGINDWTPYVEIDPALYRPCEVPYLRGIATKAKTVLGWEPKTTFTELAHLMVDNDIRELNEKKESCT